MDILRSGAVGALLREKLLLRLRRGTELREKKKKAHIKHQGEITMSQLGNTHDIKRSNSRCVEKNEFYGVSIQVMCALCARCSKKKK